MLRMSAGIALIVIGVIGVVLPVIPGIPLLAAGLALVAPDHLLIRWGRVRLAPWFGGKGGATMKRPARYARTTARFRAKPIMQRFRLKGDSGNETRKCSED